MAKRSRLLIYWEPYTISAEVYNDLSELIQSNSVLIVEGKTPQMVFEEVLKPLNTKGISESSLLIRQTNVKLSQFTIPLLKHKEKLAFLEQKIKREWEEEDSQFYWGHSKLRSETKSKESIQTFTLPRPFIDEFIRISKQIGALPLRAFTSHSLAINHTISKNNQNDNSIFLYDDESSIILVMIEKNQPVLIREMPFSSFLDKEEEFQRLSKEIQRTWLYAKQQYKFFPTKLEICGSDLYSHKDALTGLIDEVVVEEVEQQDWRHSLLNSAVIESSNLIPRRIQLIQRTIRIAHIWAIMMIVLLSIIFFWEIYNRGELSALKEKIAAENILEKNLNFEKEIAAKTILKDSIQSLLDQESLVQTQSNSPIPAWVLMYLSENIPNNLVLNNVKIERTKLPNVWNLTLRGFSPRNPIEAAEVLRSFDNQTQDDFGKLNLKIDWKVSWLKNLKSGRALDVDDLVKPFILEGVLQE